MSQWSVWEDPSDGCVYAFYVSNPVSSFSRKRLWELCPNGNMREVSIEVVVPPPSACAIEALGNLSKTPKLIQPAVIALDGVTYARNGDEVWCYDDTVKEWLPAIPTPPALVKLKGGGLAIRDE